MAIDSPIVLNAMHSPGQWDRPNVLYVMVPVGITVGIAYVSAV